MNSYRAAFATRPEPERDRGQVWKSKSGTGPQAGAVARPRKGLRRGHATGWPGFEAGLKARICRSGPGGDGKTEYLGGPARPFNRTLKKQRLIPLLLIMASVVLSACETSYMPLCTHHCATTQGMERNAP